MKCPVDPDTDLLMSERQGIEIDYCPKCRGVWLDRGEIDKLIERSIVEEQRLGDAPPAKHYSQPHSDYASRRDYDDDDDHRPRGSSHDSRQRRKESWFGDLFD